jgi:GNAT superfamily N-acetyltransferase
VRQILDDFLATHDPACERGWIAQRYGQRLGSIFCVCAQEGVAKLRLFLLVPQARGSGAGRALIETCMEFARGKGGQRMILWTHESHQAACALYAKMGWRLEDSRPTTSFGVNVVEQHRSADL